ncbi:MAG: hypothetical protein JXR95_02050 [Deltaproteobacteria bacterium]|nr:hypothetical protein [Deltaproteobacteria bacterium]
MKYITLVLAVVLFSCNNSDKEEKKSQSHVKESKSTARNVDSRKIKKAVKKNESGKNSIPVKNVNPLDNVVKPVARKSITKLLSSGNGKKQKLRYRFAKTFNANMKILMKMGMGIVIDGKPLPKNTIPSMEMVMNFKTIDVRKDGTLIYDFNTTKAYAAATTGISPAQVEMTNKGLNAMVGFSGTVEVDSRGLTKKVDYRLPPNLPPHMKKSMQNIRQQIENMGVAFPEEAIGVNGTWEVVSQIISEGLVIENKATYKLVSLKGDTGSLEVTISQSAPAQKYPSTSLPPGIEMYLKDWKSTGGGKVEFELTKPTVKSSAKMNMSMKNEVTQKATGAKQNMDMTINIELSFAPEKN